jgi:WD40 repeat protein
MKRRRSKYIRATEMAALSAVLLVALLALAGCGTATPEPTPTWGGVSTLPPTVVSGLAGPVATAIAAAGTATLPPPEATPTPEATLGPPQVGPTAPAQDAWLLTSEGLAQVEPLMQVGGDGLPYHQSGVIAAAAWSPDGGRLAVAGSEGAAVVDGSTLGLVAAFDTGMAGEAVAINGAGLVAVGGAEAVQVWDSSSGERLYSLEASGSAVQFSQDGSLLSNGETVWAVSDGSVLAALEPPAQSAEALGPVRGVAFSVQGGKVGAVYANGDMPSGTAGSGERISQSAVRNEQLSCRASAWGGWLAVLCDLLYEGLQDTFAEVWYLNLEEESPTARMFRNYDPHGEMALLPGGAQAASGEGGQVGWLGGDAAAGTLQMEVWDLVSAMQVGAGPAPAAAGELGRFVFSPQAEGRKLATWSESTLQLFDAASGEGLAVAQSRVAGVSGMAFGPRGDGYVLALGREDGMLELWSLAPAEGYWQVQAHSGAVSGLAFSPDGGSLASAGGDGLAQVWNLANGSQAASFDLNGYGTLSGLAFSPDGQRLAVAAEDVLLLDAASGTVLTTLDLQNRAIGLAFSPDGSVLVTFSEDGTVEMWQATDGTQLASVELLAAPLGGAVFSPDLCVVAYGVEPAGSIEWWDMIDSRTMQVSEQQEVVTALAFSLDGRLLAVGSEQGTALIWGLAGALEAEEGEPVSTYCGGVTP